MSTKATLEKTLVPSTGLVVDNPSKAGGPPLFCLFTQDWLMLQTFIAQAVLLPISVGDFKEKYGTFTDEAAVKGCVDAMTQVQGLSVDFGDPNTLVKDLAKNPAILQTDKAPEELYIHIVWFATKLYEQATTFNQTLGEFMETLNSTPADQRQTVVNEILTGDGGLQSTAKSQAALANDLNKAMAQFNLKLKPSTDTLSDYTSNESKFLRDVNAAITTDISNLAKYSGEAKNTYKLWSDLTIAASAGSIGIMIISLGTALPVAAAAAGILGSQAKNARDAYEQAMDKFREAEEDEQKKIRLFGDLIGLNVNLADVNTAAQNFKEALEKVEGVWLNIANSLAYIAKTFTPEQFENLPVWKEAMKLDQATQDWKTIADKADEYTANSLVSYYIVPLGKPLPANPTS